jgi:hypothetical protein
MVIYTEAHERSEKLLTELEEIYEFLFERAALSHRMEAKKAWECGKAAIYDLRDMVTYLEILKRE